MPLGEFEAEILRLLAANRNPDSHLGGATILHKEPGSPRISQDIDLFHDTEESLYSAYVADSTTLRSAGYIIEPTQSPERGFRRAVVRRADQATKVEWVYDSAFRFFPIEPDPQFGWRLNFWDAATSKILALIGRQMLRDYIDCLYLHEQHLHLGALAWAAAGKDAGLSPELIVDWAARGNHFHPQDLAEVRLNEPFDLRAGKKKWLQALHEARTLIAALPPAEIGCLYLNSAGSPVCPDPRSAAFANLTRHFGRVKGAWPKIVSS